MTYVYWSRVLSIFGWSLYRCMECGSIYVAGYGYKKRLLGESCTKHIRDYKQLKSDTTNP